MLEPHDHNHVALVFHYLKEYWMVAGLVAGGIAGSFWLVMHKVFASRASQELCKTDLQQALKDHEAWEAGQYKERRQEESSAHDELKTDIRHIRATVDQILLTKDKQ